MYPQQQMPFIKRLYLSKIITFKFHFLQEKLEFPRNNNLTSKNEREFPLLPNRKWKFMWELVRILDKQNLIHGVCAKVFNAFRGIQALDLKFHLILGRIQMEKQTYIKFQIWVRCVLLITICLSCPTCHFWTFLFFHQIFAPCTKAKSLVYDKPACISNAYQRSIFDGK